MLETHPDRDQGFTLIELLFVIVILGILGTVVAFAVVGITDRGTDSAQAADETTIVTAEEAYKAQEGSYSDEQGLVDYGLMRDHSKLHDIDFDPVSGDYTLDYVGPNGGPATTIAAPPTTLAPSYNMQVFGDGSIYVIAVAPFSGYGFDFPSIPGNGGSYTVVVYDFEPGVTTIADVGAMWAEFNSAVAAISGATVHAEVVGSLDLSIMVFENQRVGTVLSGVAGAPLAIWQGAGDLFPTLP